MKLMRLGFILLLAIASSPAVLSQAQSGESYRGLLTARVRSQTRTPSTVT